MKARIRGSLLGGAIGDALGGAVEFMDWAEIAGAFGPAGIRDFAPAYGSRGAITDDTQMTLFTAEGLLCAPDADGRIPSLHAAYLRWLGTQGQRLPIAVPAAGWLSDIAALHSARAPGNTCLFGLLAATALGQPSVAQNDSKGCGGVMRVAPVGLFAPAIGPDSAVFDLASAAAALTHGHPSGYLSAGHLAVTIAALLRGADLPAALDTADAELRQRPDHHEVAARLAQARILATQGLSPARIESLGGGWVAEEALAIAVACALAAHDFAEGVILAANHSGDSDSTAAIAGNLLGALLGETALPPVWLAGLELRAEITRMADTLHAAIASGIPPPDGET